MVSKGQTGAQYSISGYSYIMVYVAMRSFDINFVFIYIKFLERITSK